MSGSESQRAGSGAINYYPVRVSRETPTADLGKARGMASPELLDAMRDAGFVLAHPLCFEKAIGDGVVLVATTLENPNDVPRLTTDPVCLRVSLPTGRLMGEGGTGNITAFYFRSVSSMLASMSR